MKDPLRGLPERARGRVVAAEQPSWVAPMLATLTGRRFSDPGWVFEPKFDGERCLAFRDGSQVRLLSRNRKRLDDRYPELVAAMAAQEADHFVVEGEIVAFQGAAAASPGCSGACSSATPTRPAAAGWRSTCTCSTCCTRPATT
jgi:bifunctional non-homologous end joining protein LigD